MASKFNLNRIIKDADGSIESCSKDTVPAEPIQNDSIQVVVTGTNTTIQKIKNRVFEFIKSRQVDFKYLLLVIPIVAIFILARMVQNSQSLKSYASTNTASVSFSPSSSVLSPEATFGIWFNTSAPAGFAALEIDYDPKLVKMTEEIGLTSTALTRVVKVTSMSEANTTGKVAVVIGLDPGKAAPSGAFQIANVTLASVTLNPNISTSLTFNSGAFQIVGNDRSVFGVTSKGLSLVLNPVATPTPIASATPGTTTSPSVVPFSTPAQTQTPSCLKCFKNACNGICAKSDSRTLCPDCL